MSTILLVVVSGIRGSGNRLCGMGGLRVSVCVCVCVRERKTEIEQKDMTN